MIQLRDYQRSAINQIEEYILERKGNPCVVAPTGSGKSIMLAKLIEELEAYFPHTRVLLLTHQKELIEQDMSKLKLLAPKLDIGVYSASLGEKDAGHDVTFASIQSIWKRTDLMFDCILVDECHLINNEEHGIYQKFLKAMNAVTIGFTATPYRLGQGALVEDGSIFDDYIETIGIVELQNLGYLSRLTTKATANLLDVSDVGKAMGEYKQNELQQKVNVFKTNDSVTNEIVSCLNVYNRRHCIIFCAGVDHSYEISRLLNEKGVPTVCVEGSMSKDERESTLRSFTSGESRCITNCDILTTGFDYPSIDCIVMLRPTLSTGKYMQEMGRGLRIAEGKMNCLVLDFAGNVKKHGPITSIVTPKRHEKGKGAAPMKVCPHCLEVVPVQTKVCPGTDMYGNPCGYTFPVHTREYELFNGDVNGDGSACHIIKSWAWKTSVSKRTGMTMYEVTFLDVDDSEIKEYIMIDKSMNGWAKRRSLDKMRKYCSFFGIVFNDFINPNCRVEDEFFFDWETASIAISHAGPPDMIFTKPNEKNPRYTDIVSMKHGHEIEKEQAYDISEAEMVHKRIEERNR